MTNEAINVFSDAMALLSGVLFWLAFVIFGFIARRYSAVFSKKTYYGLMMLAPSGILVYSALLVVKRYVLFRYPAAGEVAQLAAYVFLFVSAAFTLWAVMNFNRLLDALSRYGEEKK